MKVKKVLDARADNPRFDDILCDFLLENRALLLEPPYEFEVYLNRNVLYITNEKVDGEKIGRFEYVEGIAYFLPTNYENLPQDARVGVILFSMKDEVKRLVEKYGIPDYLREKVLALIEEMEEDDADMEDVRHMLTLIRSLIMLKKRNSRWFNWVDKAKGIVSEVIENEG